MNIKELYKEVNGNLDDFMISKAIKNIRKMLADTGEHESTETLDKLEETYRYMVEFMMRGAEDKGRHRLLADIREKLRGLADKALRDSVSAADPRHYYSTLRFNRLRSESVGKTLREYGSAVSELNLADAAGNNTLELRKKTEGSLERLFDTLYTSLGNDSDYAELSAYARSGYAEPEALAVSVSAMTLGLLEYYDRGKMNALMDIYDNAGEELAARALVGIVFATAAHPKRVKEDPVIYERISLWQDDLIAYRRLREVIRIIAGTRDTERVAAKIKDEVIPELMKLRPEMMSRLKSEESDPGEFPGMNPEWEEMLEKSGLNKKMQELGEMQSEGADLMMVTFSNLKQFPFFTKASNWFIPFDGSHSELGLNEEMRAFVDLLSDSAAMICDSDLYSLALAAAKMPQPQRDMVTGQLRMQLEQMRGEMKDQIGKSSTPAFDRAALKFVRDLYRFFKLYRKHSDFTDPFSTPLDFLSLPVIGEMMHDPEILQLIGSFYFKRGYYKDSLPLLELLAQSAEADEYLWERIGYARQRTGDKAGALEAYDRASLLKPAGPWLTERLAYTHRSLGNWSKASEFYRQALDMDPDNLSLLIAAGDTELLAGNTDSALQHYHHANYLDPESLSTARKIAWGELLKGNFEKSLERLTKVIAKEALYTDYINAGHASLLSGNIREACNYYAIAAERDLSGFETAYRNDIGIITRLGADRESLVIILDKILSR